MAPQTASSTSPSSSSAGRWASTACQDMACSAGCAHERRSGRAKPTAYVLTTQLCPAPQCDNPPRDRSVTVEVAESRCGVAERQLGTQLSHAGRRPSAPGAADQLISRSVPHAPSGRNVPAMTAVRSGGVPDRPGPPPDVTSLIPLVRRVIAARVSDRATQDDLVQETLTRVLTAAPRVEPGLLESYAIVTARNVVASLWREHDRQRRNQHRVVDLHSPDAPDTELLAQEEQGAVARALAQLSAQERE